LIGQTGRVGLLPSPFYAGGQPFFVMDEITAFRAKREADMKQKERVDGDDVTLSLRGRHKMN
jgi:hypothetical protein